MSATTINNERIKLIANALDRISSTCITVGIATPLAGYLYNVGNFGATLGLLRLTTCVTGWLLAAIALHSLARRILKWLI